MLISGLIDLAIDALRILTSGKNLKILINLNKRRRRRIVVSLANIGVEAIIRKSKTFQPLLKNIQGLDPKDAILISSSTVKMPRQTRSIIKAACLASSGMLGKVRIARQMALTTITKAIAISKASL
jgi:hypothetical protein